MEEANSNLFQVAQFLRDELDAFIACTAKTTAAGMRIVLEFAALHMPGAMEINDRAPSCKGKHDTGAIQSLQTTCEHSCPENREVMSPALWSALPNELLQIIFARLPLADIIRLKCVSKEWKTSVGTVHSEFNRVCETTNNFENSIALITMDEEMYGVFWVRVLDMKANKWHEWEFDSGDEYSVALAACDGGLVCLFSIVDYSSKSLFLTVWNLMTQERNQLPYLDHLTGDDTTMVRLSVDPQTKHYKVMVAHDRVEDLGAYIYDSQSRQWSKVEKSSGTITGMYCYWYEDEDVVESFTCKYDLHKQEQLDIFDILESLRIANVVDYEIMEHRVFVLHGYESEPLHRAQRMSELRDPAYWISEYAFNNLGSLEFVKILSVCPFVTDIYCQYWQLFAYKGFLMVCAQNGENEDSPYHYQHFWLYNLSTRKWCDLPNPILYKKINGGEADHTKSMMCELRPWQLL